MPYCNECGTEIPSDAEYCQKCRSEQNPKNKTGTTSDSLSKLKASLATAIGVSFIVGLPMIGVAEANTYSCGGGTDWGGLLIVFLFYVGTAGVIAGLFSYSCDWSNTKLRAL